MALAGSTNIAIISVVFSALALIAVLMRFRARALQQAKYALDDWLIIPGMVKNYCCAFHLQQANLHSCWLWDLASVTQLVGLSDPLNLFCLLTQS
jgi:hypothetical protein